MNLSQLSLEMWEKLNYQGIDASVISRVLTGERLFTSEQLEIFCQINELPEKMKKILKKSLTLDLLGRFGLDVDRYDEFVDGQNLSVLRNLSQEYFQLLLDENDYQTAAYKYWLDHLERFWSGDFHQTLEELEEFERYIYRINLDKEKKGRYWLVAIIAARGHISTHQITSETMTTDSGLAQRVIERIENLADSGNQMKNLALNSWGTIMRLIADQLVLKDPNCKNALPLYQQSLNIRREIYRKIDKNDPGRLIAQQEMMISAAQIGILFPKIGDYESESEDYLEMNLDEAGETKKGSEPFLACLFEYCARIRLFDIYVKKLRGQKIENKEAEQEKILKSLDASFKLIKKVGRKAGVIETNSVVSRLKAFTLLDEKPPKQYKDEAVGLVVKTGDVEQAGRLFGGF